MKRRDFFVRIGGMALALPVVTKLAACGDDGGDPPPPDAPPAPDAPPPDAPAQLNCDNGTDVTIGTNHGHELVVSAADVAAGAEKTYNIQGVSAHPHTVVLTAADFTALQQGQTVTVTSSNDAAHTHEVTVVCAAA